MAKKLLAGGLKKKYSGFSVLVGGWRGSASFSEGLEADLSASDHGLMTVIEWRSR